jgi:hypothetical protein
MSSRVRNEFIYFVILVIVAISTLLLYSTTSEFIFVEAISDVNFTDYQSSAYALKIRYPTNWTLVETDQNYIPNTINSVVVFKSPINKTSTTYDATATIQVYGDLSIENFTKFINRNLNNLSLPSLQFNLTSKNITSSLSDLTGIASFEFKIDTKEFSGIRIYKLNNSYVYIVTFITEASKFKLYLPILYEMVNSLRIVND